MNKKLLLTTLIAAATLSSSHVFGRRESIAESVDAIFRNVGEELKSLLPLGSQTLKRVPSNATEYRYELSIPGRNASHVSAQVDNDQGIIYISVKSTTEKECDDTTGGIHTHEVSTSSNAFEQSFTPPLDADLDKVKVEVKDGLLSLTMPKKPTKNRQKELRQLSVNGKEVSKAVEVK